MTSSIASSSQIHSPQTRESFGEQCLKKVRQRAEDINKRSNTTHPPLFCISFDLDNTLIEDLRNKKQPSPTSQEELDHGLWNDYKGAYPNQDFIEKIKTTIDKLVNMGIPILPLLVTSSYYIRPAIIIQSSPLKEIFSPKQIYARGTFTLEDDDKTKQNIIEYHTADKYYQYMNEYTNIDNEITDDEDTLRDFYELHDIKEYKAYYYELKERTDDEDTLKDFNELHDTKKYKAYYYEIKERTDDEDTLDDKDPLKDFNEPDDTKQYAEEKNIPKLFSNLEQSPFKDKAYYHEVKDRMIDKTMKDKNEYIQKFINQLQKDKLIANTDDIILLHFGDETSDKRFVENLNNSQNYQNDSVKVQAQYQEINFQTLLNNIKAENTENTSYDPLKSYTESKIAKIISEKLHSFAQEKYQDLYKK